MDAALGPRSRQIVDRLRAIDFLRQDVDRPRGESAMAGLLQALELSPRPAQWMQDVESGLREYLQATWTMYQRSPEPREPMRHTMGRSSPFLDEIHRIARFEVTDPEYFSAVGEAHSPPKQRGFGIPEKVENSATEESWKQVEEAFESTSLRALRNVSSEAATSAARSVLNSLGPREGETGHDPALWVLHHTGASHGFFLTEEARYFLHTLAGSELEGRFDEHHRRGLIVLGHLTDALEAGVWIGLPLRSKMLLVPRPPVSQKDLSMAKAIEEFGKSHRGRG